MIKRIISGGQTGADQAGLAAANSVGIPTGGYAPKDWITKTGPNPELLRDTYNLSEYDGGYKDRTWANVQASCGTIRFAVDFDSPGEKCTLNAVIRYTKPYADVDLTLLPQYEAKLLKETSLWILDNKIEVLNIAGNTQGKKGFDIFTLTYNYLTLQFMILSNLGLLTLPK